MTWTAEQGRATNSNSLAFTNNVKANSLLLVGQDIDNSNADALPTDTRGTTYTPIDETVTGGSQRIKWWYGFAPGAGANTVTCASGSFNGITIAEFSENSGGTISLDVETTSAQSGVASWNSASLTANLDNSLIIAYAGSDNGAAGTISATAPSILVAQAAISSSAGDGQGMVYKFVNAGSQSVAFAASGSFRGETHVAIFKVAAAGPPDTSAFVVPRWVW